MAGLARTCVTVLVTAAGLVTACGHLPFDELPVMENGLSSTDGSVSGVDGSPPTEGGLLDAGVIPPDGGGFEDGGVIEIDGAAGDSSTCDECTISHVSPLGDDQVGDGSKARPYRTITKAVEVAGTNDQRREIHIASGTFREKVLVTLTNLKISGGYDDCGDPKNCRWSQPLANDGSPKSETIIQTSDEPTTGTTFASLIVRAPADNTTILERLHVIGRPGAQVKALITGSIAVLVQGATPRFNKVVFEGGQVDDVAGGVDPRRSVGLFISSTLVAGEAVQVFDDSRLRGGVTTGASAGLWIDAQGGTTARVKVFGSTLSGASAASSYGVYVNDIDPSSLIESSFITSSVSTATAEDNLSWGVRASSGFKLWRNRINWNANTSKTFCTSSGGTTPAPKGCGGVLLLATTNMDIESNLIGAVRAPLSAAVYLRVAAAKTTSVSINGNVLSASGDDDGLSAALAVSITSAPSGAAPTVYVRNNILLGGPNDKAKRYGVFEVTDASAKTHITALTHNVFWNVDTAYLGWDKTEYTDVDTAPLAAGNNHPNYKADPLFKDAEGHTQTTSPGYGLGFFQSEFVKSPDIDGDPRSTVSMDIGADEIP